MRHLYSPRFICCRTKARSLNVDIDYLNRGAGAYDIDTRRPACEINADAECRCCARIPGFSAKVTIYRDIITSIKSDSR